MAVSRAATVDSEPDGFTPSSVSIASMASSASRTGSAASSAGVRTQPSSRTITSVSPSSIAAPPLLREAAQNFLATAKGKARKRYETFCRDNAWWLDVLENGPAAVHAAFFDIDWHPHKPELDNKVLLPILMSYYKFSPAEAKKAEKAAQAVLKAAEDKVKAQWSLIRLA